MAKCIYQFGLLENIANVQMNMLLFFNLTRLNFVDKSEIVGK